MFDLSSIRPHIRIQLHVLRSHSASNLNRDEMGRPKEVQFGGTTRQRVSSQSKKRAIRMGEIFDSFRLHAAEHYGCTPMIRTTHVVKLLTEAMEQRGLPTDKALEGAKAVLDCLSKKAEKEVQREGADDNARPHGARSARTPAPAHEAARMAQSQLLALSTGEVDALADQLSAVEDKSKADWAQSALKNSKPLKDRGNRCGRGELSPELQLFGRMVTSDLFSNIDSPLQMAHSFTVHATQAERDYWTGADDQRLADGVSGSGMIDVRRFSAGVFYDYAAIDVDQLIKNMKAAFTELSVEAINALTVDLLNAFMLAFATQNPTGYQNSFASHAMPEMMVIEVGGAFPHSAQAAYEKAITSDSEGYSRKAKIAFYEWMGQREKMFGKACFGQLHTLGLQDNEPAMNEMIIEASRGAMERSVAGKAPSASIHLSVKSAETVKNDKPKSKASKPAKAAAA